MRLTRPVRIPRPLLAAAATLGVVAAACGGGSGNADATPAPVTSPGELESFRFAVTMKIEGMGGTTGSPGVTTDASFDVTASGAVVTPDRAQATVKADLGFIQMDLETITIGDQTWTREPGAEWQLGGVEDDLLGMGELADPEAILTEEDEAAMQDLQSVLDRLESTRERVNDRDAIRYDLTDEKLRELAEDPELADLFEGIEEMGDADLDMALWFDIETGVPLRVTLKGTGVEEGVEGTVDMELNLTDVNADISIEPPA